MSLRVLIVGRGQSADEVVSEGHVLSFVDILVGADGALVDLEPYSFLLLHLNNDDASIACEEWNKSKGGGRIVGISGGDKVPEEFQNAGLPFLGSVASQQQVLDLAWRRVPSSFQGGSAELADLLGARGVDHLRALAILCQGYLAACARANTIAAESDVGRALQSMGWLHSDHANFISDTAWGEVQDPLWWLHVFNVPVVSRPQGGSAVSEHDWEVFVARVRSEWGMHELPKTLVTILSNLKRVRPVDDPQDVAQAYAVIKEHLAVELPGRP